MGWSAVGAGPARFFFLFSIHIFGPGEGGDVEPGEGFETPQSRGVGPGSNARGGMFCWLELMVARGHVVNLEGDLGEVDHRQTNIAD